MPIDPDRLPSNVATVMAKLSAQAPNWPPHAPGWLSNATEPRRCGHGWHAYCGLAFGRSSEKLLNQLEQLELTLADLDERIAETEPKDAEPIAADPIKPLHRPLPGAPPGDVIENAVPFGDIGQSGERSLLSDRANDYLTSL